MFIENHIRNIYTTLKGSNLCSCDIYKHQIPSGLGCFLSWQGLSQRTLHFLSTSSFYDNSTQPTH